MSAPAIPGFVISAGDKIWFISASVNKPFSKMISLIARPVVYASLAKADAFHNQHAVTKRLRCPHCGSTSIRNVRGQLRGRLIIYQRKYLRRFSNST